MGLSILQSSVDRFELDQVNFVDHIKYTDMFLETSYFDRIYDVGINDLDGYKERTRVLYMISFFLDL